MSALDWPDEPLNDPLDDPLDDLDYLRSQRLIPAYDAYSEGDDHGEKTP